MTHKMLAKTEPNRDPTLTYGGPKGSNTNQFTKTQNSFPKTQINFPKHKLVYQSTNQFPKTQISLPKHKTIS